MSSSCVLLHHVYCTVDYILTSSQKSALFITRFSIKSYHVSRNAIVKHLCQLKESIMKTSRNVNARGIKIGIVWLPLPWYNISNVLEFAYSEIVLELSRWEVNALDINSGRVMFTWCNINTVLQEWTRTGWKHVKYMQLQLMWSLYDMCPFCWLLVVTEIMIDTTKMLSSRKYIKQIYTLS